MVSASTISMRSRAYCAYGKKSAPACGAAGSVGAACVICKCQKKAKRSLRATWACEPPLAHVAAATVFASSIASIGGVSYWATPCSIASAPY